MSASDSLADHMTRLIWTVLLDAGRGDLADAVADQLAGTRGADLRIRAIGALRAVLATVLADPEAEELIRRGVMRDELALLTDDDRRLVERVSAMSDVDAAGRRRARRLVADLLDRVAQVLRAPHGTMPRIASTASTPSLSEHTCRAAAGTDSDAQPGPATTTVV